jgi:hypothetical protein
MRIEMLNYIYVAWSYMKINPCYVGPCHSSMVHSQVSDGGDDLQMWRLAAKVMSKQSQTADKGWFSGVRVG